VYWSDQWGPLLCLFKRCVIIYILKVSCIDISGQVHRALLYSVEGIFKTPGFKTGAFSKANWGDYSTQSAHGETTIKRASVFLKRITTLKDQQWDDIYKAALATQEHSKPGDVGEHGRSGDDGSTGEESSEDDSELFDPLYDGSPSPSCSGQVSEEV
jgi:hypothetical protein